MRAVQVFLSSGSHFVTHAEWGCLDGHHKAWLIVETKNKHEARRILPAAYQRNAKIVKLHKFSRKDIETSVMDYHSD